MKKLIALAALLVLGFYVGWPAFSGWQLQSALERKDAATVGRKVDFPSVRASLHPVVVREVNTGIERYLADLGPLVGMMAPWLKDKLGPQIVDATLNTLITPENIVKIYAEKDDMRSAAERILMEELNKPGGVFAGVLGGGKPGDGGPGLADRMRLPGGLGGFGESVQKGLGGVAGGQVPDIKTVLTKIIEKQRQARGAKPALEAAPAPAAGGGGFGVGNIKRFGFNGPLAMEVGVAAKATSPKPDVLAEMAFRGMDWKVTRLVPGL